MESGHDVKLILRSYLSNAHFPISKCLLFQVQQLKTAQLYVVLYSNTVQFSFSLSCKLKLATKELV